MAVCDEDFNCRKCGHPLDWVDTIDTEGGINEGYIIERQEWVCHCCNQSYIIEQRADIGEGDVDITDFQES